MKLPIYQLDAFTNRLFGGNPAALGARPREAYRARDLLAIFDDESDVRALRPDFARVAALDAFAIIVSAPGDTVDFVSRFFAPGAGIPEDPVTGSSHCTLAPYWAARLGKNQLRAQQLSTRGGELQCELRGERVVIAGQVVEYLRGEIETGAPAVQAPFPLLDIDDPVRLPEDRF